MFGKKRKLFKLFNITVSVELSVLIIALLLFTGLGPYFQMGLSEDYPGIVEAVPLLPWLLSLAAVLMVFVSILFHEYAHSLLAKKFGAKVEEIHLFMFGGVSLIQHTEHSNTPKKDFAIAAIGPISSVLLALMFFPLFLVSALAFDGIVGAVLGQLLFYLMLINVILAAFNAIPMFPVDGGRALVAFLRILGMKETKATVAGAKLGVVLSLGLISFGLAGFFIEELYPNLWVALIGGFILMLNRAEAKSAKIRGIMESAFEGVRVRDVYQAYITPYQWKGDAQKVQEDPAHCSTDDYILDACKKLFAHHGRKLEVVHNEFIVGTLQVHDICKALHERGVEECVIQH